MSVKRTVKGLVCVDEVRIKLMSKILNEFVRRSRLRRGSV